MDTHAVIALAASLREKANRYIKDRLREEGVEGIDPAYGSILRCLFDGHESTMGELAGDTGRDKSTVTVLVAKLERLGYLERRGHPEDGRAVLVRLTPQGEELRGPFERVSRDLLQKAYEGFTEEEQKTLVLLLSKAGDNL